MSFGDAPKVGRTALARLAARLDPAARAGLSKAVRLWLKVKRRGGKVVVATGSGPNLHEGVTTQIAELVHRGLVDGVLTSSAVVGHEMAGCLELVRRVDGRALGLPAGALPKGGKLEAALLPPGRWRTLARHCRLDRNHHRRMLAAPGHEIVKVAGNLAYPSGLWLEEVARRLLPLAREQGRTLEALAGAAADRRTMLGACARRRVPCLVTVPQLVGGGQVGLAVGDSIPISDRSVQVARLLARADLIVESGVALTQEIHDGPFETYTGHGLWASLAGGPGFSLERKAVVRIDLDPRLAAARQKEAEQAAVSHSIDAGLPKSLHLGVPFRMEMSGFARLPGALPLVADLGLIWPLLASRVAKGLGVKVDFVCYKQGTDLGEALRRWIVERVGPLDAGKLLKGT